jgi:GPH family glycoside/pentoside/hexuronide:cation symporter
MVERMSAARCVAYSFGMAGFQIPDRIVVAIALYYYLPPPGRGLAPQVSQEIFLGVLTVFGLAMLIGRVFDAVVDPLVGYASDRSRSRLGRRRSFLVYGIVPMLVLPALLFWPPRAPGSTLNGISLAIVLAAYFIAFTVYVAPYLALIPELATDGRARTRLSTLLALVSFSVLGLYAAAWPYGIELGRQLGASSENAVRGVVVLSLGVAFVFCLLPILAVDEQRFTRTVSSELSFKQALLCTVSNRPFLIYLAAVLLLIFAATLMAPAAVYYATVVLGRSEAFAGALSLAVFSTTLIGFVIVLRASDRIGARRGMIICNLIFAVSLASLGFLRPDVPGGPRDGLNLLIIWSAMAVMGVAVAGFLVLPYVLISQVIDYDTAKTGSNRSAMYFGTQGFLTKWMYGLGGAVIAFLFARFGNSPEQPLGVLLMGPLAGVACLLSALIFTFYPERQVLVVTEMLRTSSQSSRDRSN